MTEILSTQLDPDYNCDLCPRLHDFIAGYRESEPEWFNGPVPSFGNLETAKLLVVGLAPGLRGANRTGRPFTGDYAGDLLYQVLEEFGFARGSYDKRPDDGLELVEAAITNAVRCVPPQNKPTGPEIKQCRPFLLNTIEAMPKLKGYLVLGRIAHETLLRTFDLKLKDYPFSHGGKHQMPNGHFIFDSYHCSRYNTNTGRLTEEMFRDVFRLIRTEIS